MDFGLNPDDIMTVYITECCKEVVSYYLGDNYLT